MIGATTTRKRRNAMPGFLLDCRVMALWLMLGENPRAVDQHSTLQNRESVLIVLAHAIMRFRYLSYHIIVPAMKGTASSCFGEWPLLNAMLSLCVVLHL